LSDLAKIDFTALPAGNSEVEYNRIRALVNYPIKLKKESTYLFLGLDYSHINLIMDENPSFDKNEINGFQLLDLNIGFTTPLKNNWRLGLRFSPGLSSNLTSNDIGIEDLTLAGQVYFINDKTKDEKVSKPWRLVLGVSYAGNNGFNFPLPYIAYYRKINTKWTYSVGVPKTNLQYHFSKKHRLKLYTQLDGFTSNIQKGIPINGTKLAESIKMTLIVGGLQYEYHFAKHMQFYVRSAYIISNSFNLRDHNRDNVKGLDDSNSLYLRTGISIKM
jgi:hypothetical protein